MEQMIKRIDKRIDDRRIVECDGSCSDERRKDAGKTQEGGDTEHLGAFITRTDLDLI